MWECHAQALPASRTANRHDPNGARRLRCRRVEKSSAEGRRPAHIRGRGPRRPHRPTLPWAASDAAALMTETSSSAPHAPSVTVTERVAW